MAESLEKCQHKTGQEVETIIDGDDEYVIWRCHWGCNKLLVDKVDGSCYTETWELDSRPIVEALRILIAAVEEGDPVTVGELAARYREMV